MSLLQQVESKELQMKSLPIGLKLASSCRSIQLETQIFKIEYLLGDKYDIRVQVSGSIYVFLACPAISTIFQTISGNVPDSDSSLL
jgi:hypothetical protein